MIFNSFFYRNKCIAKFLIFQINYKKNCSKNEKNTNYEFFIV